MTVRIAVLASGSGTNLQALIDSFARDDDVSIHLVLSDRAAAGALDRARSAGIAAEHIQVRERSSDDVARTMLDLLDRHRIDMIALAGYLRLVPAQVTERFRERIINIHPALLPAFGGTGMYGLRVHEAVLAAGCTVTGATVHFVDERYDEGRILVQWPVPVLPGDDAAVLAARVLQVEHRLFPVAVAALARRLGAERGSAGVKEPQGERESSGAEERVVFRSGDSVEGLESEIARLINATLSADGV